MKLSKLFISCIFATSSTFAFAASSDSELTKGVDPSVPVVQLEAVVVASASEDVTVEDGAVKQNSVEKRKGKRGHGFDASPEFKAAFKECKTSVLGDVDTTKTKEDRAKVNKEQRTQIGQCMNDKGFVAKHKHKEFSEEKRKVYGECRDKTGFSKDKKENKKLSEETLTDMKTKFKECVKESGIKSHKATEKTAAPEKQ